MTLLKRIFPILVIMVFIACIVSSCSNVSGSTDHQQSPDNDTGVSNRVDIVYFHTPRRCVACIYVEERFKLIANTKFAEEMASGKLRFRSYDLGVKANSSLIKKYGAVGSQLFVNTVRDGKDNIQHVIEVWDPKLLDDQEAFDDYAQKLIRKSLDGV